MKAKTEVTYRSHAIKGGIMAGLVGGAALSVFMLITSLAQNQDVWLGMKMAGAPFLGERASEPGFDFVPVVIGVASHFLVSAVWGLLFGVIFYGFGKAATVALGALWGIVVWLGMFYVVLPIVGLASVAKAVPVGFAVFEHVLFGAAVGVGFLPFQHPRQPVEPRAPLPISGPHPQTK
jgi:hypothetical protein